MAGIQLSTSFLMAALEGIAPHIKATQERRLVLGDAMRRADLSPFCAGGPERVVAMPEQIPSLFWEITQAADRAVPRQVQTGQPAISLSQPGDTRPTRKAL